MTQAVSVPALYSTQVQAHGKTAAICTNAAYFAMPVTLLVQAGHDFILGRCQQHMVQMIPERLPFITGKAGNPGKRPVDRQQLELCIQHRSEERRVGKECRSRWAPCQKKKKGET